MPEPLPEPDPVLEPEVGREPDGRPEPPLPPVPPVLVLPGLMLPPAPPLPPLAPEPGLDDPEPAGVPVGVGWFTPVFSSFSFCCSCESLSVCGEEPASFPSLLPEDEDEGESSSFC